MIEAKVTKLLDDIQSFIDLPTTDNYKKMDELDVAATNIYKQVYTICMPYDQIEAFHYILASKLTLGQRADLCNRFVNKLQKCYDTELNALTTCLKIITETESDKKKVEKFSEYVKCRVEIYSLLAKSAKHMIRIFGFNEILKGTDDE